MEIVVSIRETSAKYLPSLPAEVAPAKNTKVSRPPLKIKPKEVLRGFDLVSPRKIWILCPTAYAQVSLFYFQ